MIDRENVLALLRVLEVRPILPKHINPVALRELCAKNNIDFTRYENLFGPKKELPPMKPRDPLPRELHFRAARDNENWSRPTDQARCDTDPTTLAVPGEVTIVGVYRLIKTVEIEAKMVVSGRTIENHSEPENKPPTGKKAK